MKLRYIAEFEVEQPGLEQGGAGLNPESIARSINEVIQSKARPGTVRYAIEVLPEPSGEEDAGLPTEEARRRNEIIKGTTVDIVLKKDQPTGKLTRGIVSDILTNSAYHPRGIKVRLADGQVGRVQRIV